MTCGQGCLEERTENSKCQRPELQVNLVCLKIKKGTVALTWQGRGRVDQNEVRQRGRRLGKELGLICLKPNIGEY